MEFIQGARSARAAHSSAALAALATAVPMNLPWYCLFFSMWSSRPCRGRDAAAAIRQIKGAAGTSHGVVGAGAALPAVVWGQHWRMPAHLLDPGMLAHLGVVTPQRTQRGRLILDLLIGAHTQPAEGGQGRAPACGRAVAGRVAVGRHSPISAACCTSEQAALVHAARPLPRPPSRAALPRLAQRGGRGRRARRWRGRASWGAPSGPAAGPAA